MNHSFEATCTSVTLLGSNQFNSELSIDGDGSRFVLPRRLEIGARYRTEVTQVEGRSETPRPAANGAAKAAR